MIKGLQTGTLVALLACSSALPAMSAGDPDFFYRFRGLAASTGETPPGPNPGLGGGSGGGADDPSDPGSNPSTGTLSLSGAERPLFARAGKQWSFGFETLLSTVGIDRGAVSWSSSDLPEGLELDAALGTVSGSPATRGDAAFEITAAAGDVRDSRRYSITVGNAALRVSSIAMGPTNNHICAVTMDEKAVCWGLNDRGQLGDGTTISRAIPTKVVDLPGPIRSVAVGHNHSCAITTTDELYCWGDNAKSKTGSSSPATYAPRPLKRANAIRKVAIGSQHGCAIGTSGTLICWGDNQYGQVGMNSTHTLESGLRSITSIGAVREVTVGNDHSCASTEADGSVWCWGKSGSLGLGADNQNKIAPTRVAGTASVAQLSSSGYHTCALTTDGSVSCWGTNNNLQTGQPHCGSSLNLCKTSSPYKVANLGSGATAITTGASHSCAMNAAGIAVCWGGNSHGVIGRNQSNIPGPIPILSRPASMVYAGSHVTCVTEDDGSALCWGWDRDGKLGTGNATPTTTPIEVFDIDRSR